MTRAFGESQIFHYSRTFTKKAKWIKQNKEKRERMDDHSCCICAEGGWETTRNALCENKGHLYCKKCASRVMVTQGHCAFCLRSNPEMRGIISVAKSTTWVAYFVMVTLFMLERFVFVVLTPVLMANICSMGVISIFGDHDAEGKNNEDLLWIVYNGSWFTCSLACETFVRQFYNAKPDITLMWHTVDVINRMIRMLTWVFLKLTQMAVVALLFGTVVFLQLLRWTGPFADTLLGCTCYLVAGYITQSTWVGLMAWILVDMYADVNFRDKYMSFSAVSVEVGKRLTEGFLDRIYNKPPTTTTTVTTTTVARR